MSEIEAKPSAIMTDWVIARVSDWHQLVGYVPVHPVYGPCEDGTIRTSALLRIDFEKKIAETRNTIYHLE